jgi:RNA polymerase sigma-70 factor (ECF subfamily)
MHGTLEETRGCGTERSTHSIVGSNRPRSNGKRFLVGSPVDFYPFDEEYLRRLRAGEPEVEEHFSIYFAGCLRLKLRAGRYLAPDADDIIQETFLRALVKLRANGLRQAESLGAFVFAICKHICLERSRPRRLEPLPEDYSEFLQSPDNQERDLLEAERKRAVLRAMQEMDPKDRDLLVAYFFEEQPKDEICKKLGVSRNYLRVCLHRVKKALKRQYLKRYDQNHEKDDRES